jgi:hypothetical protein
MKLRRKLFVVGIAAVLMLAILYVPPVGAAIGPAGTTAIASAMTTFNPDRSWHEVE